MMVFADFYIEDEEEPFKHQQGTRPEEHRTRKKGDPPKVNLSRPKDSEKQAGDTNEEEIAQNMGRVHAVIWLVAIADCHPRTPLSLG